ncbi:MAG: hypothetical protein QOG85_1242 [Gaiellaceae bacterium]|jgi:hypothetical protein|nr:hypothetical protein [Gaiellaceae bacterium]
MRWTLPLHVAVAAYAGLFAVLDVVGPMMSTGVTEPRRFFVWIVIQGLIVWRLSRGSAIAWTFGLLLAIGPLALVLLAATGFDQAVPVVVIVSVAQAGLLLTQPLRGLVFSERQTSPPASA